MFHILGKSQKYLSPPPPTHYPTPSLYVRGLSHRDRNWKKGDDFPEKTRVFLKDEKKWMKINNNNKKSSN